jgi:hypothetical protein
MKKIIFVKTIVCLMFSVMLATTGCVSAKNASLNTTAALEGTWENNVFKLVIKGNYYVSLLDNVLYGRGTITYDGSFFTLASTHAWQDGYWFEVIETVSGKCTVDSSILTISDVSGRYEVFNGTWQRIDDIDLEKIIENPLSPVEGNTV